MFSLLSGVHEETQSLPRCPWIQSDSWGDAPGFRTQTRPALDKRSVLGLEQRFKRCQRGIARTTKDDRLEFFGKAHPAAYPTSNNVSGGLTRLGLSPGS